jgi:peptide/nickel transport system permease protein
MWVTDLFLSLPQLPLLLLLIYLFRDPLKAVFGPEMGIFILIVRSSAASAGCRWRGWCARSSSPAREGVRRGRARARRHHASRQVVRHILPNSLGPVIVAGTIDVAAAIIAESTLSFLGLGFPPDIPTWGRILFDAKDYLDIAPHWALFPGMAIFLAVLTINFIGDGLRDALDPAGCVQTDAAPAAARDPRAEDPLQDRRRLGARRRRRGHRHRSPARPWRGRRDRAAARASPPRRC